jgi:hypothetical protein
VLTGCGSQEVSPQASESKISQCFAYLSYAECFRSDGDVTKRLHYLKAVDQRVSGLDDDDLVVPNVNGARGELRKELSDLAQRLGSEKAKRNLHVVGL